MCGTNIDSQESRRIVGAMVQHITYNEFLPKLLGRYAVRKYGLEVTQQGFASNYDPDTDITVPAAFGAAAFRFGHSLLPDAMERWSADHKFLGSRRFSEMFQQPYDLHKPGWLDQYLLGMVNQASQAMDDSVTSQVSERRVGGMGRANARYSRLPSSIKAGEVNEDADGRIREKLNPSVY